MSTIDEYLSLPYRRVIERDASGLWSAHVAELDGVFSEGETAAEAVANLDTPMSLWIEHELARGHPIPRPARRSARVAGGPSP